MKVPFKRILVFVLLGLGAAALAFFGLTHRAITLSGTVVDCLSNQPIREATVVARQSELALVRESQTKTDRAGKFQLTFRLGETMRLFVKKKGYVAAEQVEEPKGEILVRLLAGEKPNEVTFNCRLSSQCIQTKLENGEWIRRDICNP